MLGFLQDGLQRYLSDIGPLGPDKGAGGKFLVLPPGFEGEVPEGYFVIRSPTYSVAYLVRGFQSEGKTDQAVSLIKQTKIYPLASASSLAPMEFLNEFTVIAIEKRAALSEAYEAIMKERSI